jgi:hypothetical protein
MNAKLEDGKRKIERSDKRKKGVWLAESKSVSWKKEVHKN